MIWLRIVGLALPLVPLGYFAWTAVQRIEQRRRVAAAELARRQAAFDEERRRELLEYKRDFNARNNARAS